MDPKEYIDAFDKYIEKIVLPKFPEIDRFRIRASKTKDWDYYDYIIIDFWIDEMELHRRDELFYAIESMKTYLPLPDKIRLKYYLN